MAAWLTLASFLAVYIALAAAHKNHTVTDHVFFDVEIKDYDGEGEDYRGRFVVGVFGEKCPMTALNFVSLAKGYKRGKGKTLTYKRSPIHRIVKDFIIQMGDNTVGDGTGGESIYGPKFVDENFDLSHQAAGYVSMANHGPDTNGAQFFILLEKSRWLDGKHVVFGKVIDGMDVVRTIGEVDTNPNTAMPKKSIKIVDCGVEELKKKYELTEKQAKSDDDIDNNKKNDKEVPPSF